MEKLVWIDACVRGDDSRTRALAQPMREKLAARYEIEEICLTDTALTPVNAALFAKRSAEGLDADDLRLGRTVAAADRLVIVAPFWDMGIPAVLKTLIEHISAVDVTFSYAEGGSVGICRAERLLYITTRGLEIPTGDMREQGTSYLKAVGWLWGIPEVQTVAAWGMDVVDAQTQRARLDAALQDGLRICEDF